MMALAGLPTGPHSDGTHDVFGCLLGTDHGEHERDTEGDCRRPRRCTERCCLGCGLMVKFESVPVTAGLTGVIAPSSPLEFQWTDTRVGTLSRPSDRDPCGHSHDDAVREMLNFVETRSHSLAGHLC
jgi:hypothetical protein